METTINITQILILVPIFGAILGLFFRKKPKALKGWFFAITSLILFAIFLNPESVAPTTKSLALLIALAAWLCILARYLESNTAFDLFEILILMGLGFGFLFSVKPLNHIFLAGIFALLISMQWRIGGEASAPEKFWVIGLNGLAIILLGTASLFSAQNEAILLSLAYSTLLPLFPFHGAYAVFLKRFPGALPPFLSLFLPSLGLHGLLPQIQMLPPGIKHLLLVCAISGIIIGGLRSLVQIRVPDVLSQIALVFWSVLWWHFSRPEASTNTALLFLSAVALSLCGLFLMWHGLAARFGNLIINQFGGLSSAMPRFSVLFVLLCTAAMGLPLFGVFSGFIKMAFSSTSGFSWGLLFTLFAWVFASWRIPTLMQSLLFGKQNPQWIYDDLGLGETTAFSLLLAVLFILGVAPQTLVELQHFPELSAHLSATRMENNP